MAETIGHEMSFGLESGRKYQKTGGRSEEYYMKAYSERCKVESLREREFEDWEARNASQLVGKKRGRGSKTGANKSSCKYDCGRRDTKAMICCESCESWFHFGCVNLTTDIVEQLEDWFCKQCFGVRKKKKIKE